MHPDQLVGPQLTQFSVTNYFLQFLIQEGHR